MKLKHVETLSPQEGCEGKVGRPLRKTFTDALLAWLTSFWSVCFWWRARQDFSKTHLKWASSGGSCFIPGLRNFNDQTRRIVDGRFDPEIWSIWPEIKQLIKKGTESGQRPSKSWGHHQECDQRISSASSLAPGAAPEFHKSGRAFTGTRPDEFQRLFGTYCDHLTYQIHTKCRQRYSTWLLKRINWSILESKNHVLACFGHLMNEISTYAWPAFAWRTCSLQVKICQDCRMIGVIESWAKILWATLGGSMECVE